MKALTQNVPDLIKKSNNQIDYPETTIVVQTKETYEKPIHKISFRMKIINWGVLFQIKFY